jgi:endonuclease/exonuclease/phosphatase family metal-dependent hydrolase
MRSDRWLGRRARMRVRVDGPGRRNRRVASLLASAGLAIAIMASLSLAAERGHVASVLDDPQVEAAARRSVEARKERQAARETPAGRAKREQSRRRYGGASDDAALAIARERFPELLGKPVFAPFRPDPGQRVERYLDDDQGALITTAKGGHAVVDSTLPLRGSTNSGDKQPVDLELVAQGGRFEPKAAPVRADLPKDLADGIALPYDGGTLTVTAEGASGKAQRSTGDKLFYANAARDSDLVAAALPTGAELYDIVRSVESQEAFAFRFDGLPPGGELRLTADKRAAEIVAGDKRLAVIPPPTAADADGEPVPVSLAVSDNTLALGVAHRARDVAYPLVLDPVIETFTWGGATTNNDFNYWAWGFVPGPGSPPHASGVSWAHNGPWGVGAYAYTNGGYVYNQDNGINRFTAPGDAYIYRADFNGLANWNATGSAWMCANAGIFSTSRNAADSSFYVNCNNFSGFNWGACVSGTYPNCATTAGTAGNDAETNFWGWTSAPRAAFSAVTGSGAISYLSGAAFYLNDRVNPTLQWSGDPPAYTWSGYDGPLAVIAQDSGLGVKTVTVNAPLTASGWAGATLNTGCNGTRADRVAGRCANPKTLNFSLAGLPEGPQTLHAAATDAVGNSGGFDYSLKVDRTPPATVSFGGALGGDVNKVVGRTQVGVTITGTDSYSGIASVSYKLTRTSDPATTLQQGSSSNLGCVATGCSQTYGADFTIDTSALQDGSYTLTGTATDQTGKPKTNTLVFTVDHNVLTAEQALAGLRITRPDVVSASTAVDVGGEMLHPTLTPIPVDGQYAASGSLVDATVRARYNEGVGVGADLAAVSFAPVGVGQDATDPVIADGDAAVYANSQYSTDAVVRPTGNGVETLLQLRGSTAPEDFSWQIALRSGQTLTTLPNGNVAVVDPTPQTTSNTVTTDPEVPPSPADIVVDNDGDEVPTTVDEPPGPLDEPLTLDESVSDVPDPPGLPVLSLAAGAGTNDTAGQLNRETAAAAAAQATVATNSAQAVFLTPQARDARGLPVPVTMSASGTNIALHVFHRAGSFVYPITVDPEVSAAGDDGGAGQEVRAARNHDFKMMTWNIHGNRPPNGPKDVPYGNLAGVIKTQDARVVLIQEVCNGHWLGELKFQLALRHYQMRAVFAGQKKNGTEQWQGCRDSGVMGVAILSHQVPKMKEVGSHQFANGSAGDSRRVVLAATAEAGGIDTHFYTTHLDHKSAARVGEQVKWIRKQGQWWADHVSRYVLIGGDFNVEPDYQAVQPLRDGIFSFAAPHCDSSHWTFSTNGQHKICIDLLFRFSSPFEPPTSRIVDEINKSDSDHFPVKPHIVYKCCPT